MTELPLGEPEYVIAESCRIADHVAVYDWGWRPVSPGRYIRPGTRLSPPCPVSYIDREQSMGGLRGRVVHVGCFQTAERRARMIESAQAMGMDFAGSWPNEAERRQIHRGGS